MGQVAQAEHLGGRPITVRPIPRVRAMRDVKQRGPPADTMKKAAVVRADRRLNQIRDQPHNSADEAAACEFQPVELTRGREVHLHGLFDGVHRESDACGRKEMLFGTRHDDAINIRC